MKSKRERFTERLNDVQGAQAIMMSSLEDAYAYILHSFAATTKLAIDASDAEIARLKEEQRLFESHDHPMIKRLLDLSDYAEVLESHVRYYSKPWWKRLFS